MLEKIHQVKCSNPSPEWYKALWNLLDKNLVIPTVVAVLAYWVTTFLGESKNNKNYSKLGVAIMESLIEEVRSGLEILERLKKYLQDPLTDKVRFENLLPVKSWEGSQTVPNEVLLRILASSNGVTAPFPPSEIKIHCKNYFSHICGNVNIAIQNLNTAIQKSNTYMQNLGTSLAIPSSGEFGIAAMRDQLLAGALGDGEGKGNYIESTKKVLGMLETVKNALEQNSKSIIPK
ncbi:MAG: hypothetical protein ACYCT9_13530 [Leptospirillum sp.]